MISKRLQRLWDAKLITDFFLHPHYNIQKTGWIFRNSHNLTEEEFFTLHRTPKSGDYLISADTYCFVAQNLPKLYNKIEPLDLSDLFNILDWLQTRDIQTTMRRAEQREIANMRLATHRKIKQHTVEQVHYAKLFGKGSKTNQAFFR